MRKQALALLGALLMQNPFGPELPEDRFVASLEEYTRKLQACPPALALVELEMPSSAASAESDCGLTGGVPTLA